MKRLISLFSFFFVVFALVAVAQAQNTTGFTLTDSSQVYNIGMAVTDTGNPGPGYRMIMSTNYAQVTPNLTAYTLYAKDYSGIPQQPLNIPPTITMQANSPLWTIINSSNGGNCRIAIAADDGNGNGGVSQFNYVFPSASWGTYTFQLAGISKISATDKQELMNLFEMKNISTTYPFKRLRIAFSFLSGETGTRVVFFDNITFKYANGTVVVIDDGSGTGIVTLNAPTLVLPTNGAINVAVPTAFSWNPVTGATSYTLQISTVSDFSSLVVNQTGLTGTSVQVSGLQPNTTYYWRVNATDGTHTSAWSSVWTFTTASGVVTLNVPPQISPTNGATNTGPNPIFLWNAVPTATSYHLQVSTTSDFSSGVSAYQVTDTAQQVIGLNQNTTYYWRVNAANSSTTSAWSSTWSFSTGNSGGGLPGVPTLVSPLNGSTGFPINGTLVWNSSANAITYEVQVLDHDGNIVFTTSTANTSVVVSGLAYSTTYYWRVNAHNSAGVSNWSSTWNFTTRSAPVTLNAPTLVSPTNGAANVAVPTTFSWNAVTGATSYTLQASTASDFSSLVVNQTGLTGTSVQVSGLSPNTAYYWRVNATDGTHTSAWSSVWGFTTAPATITVGTVILSFPPNNATGISLDVNLSWNTATNAVNYEVQAARNSSFVNPVFTNTGSAMNIVAHNLGYATTYYWHVRGVASDGTKGPWSDTWSFTTLSITGVSEVNGVPDKFALAQNYPNPFNPTTSIKYQVASITYVTLVVYDILGREIKTLVNKEQTPGEYTVNFDASKLSSGLYIYRLVAGDFVSVKKMTLIK